MENEKLITAKNAVKQIVPMIGASVLVVGIFLLYLVGIGIPKTSARNYYNQAILAIKSGEISVGIGLLEQALDNWDEPYIREELNQVKQLLQ